MDPLPPPTPAEIETASATSGQRRINLIWEFTQATIALAVCASTLVVAAILATREVGLAESFLLLSNGFFLVIGFYFGRTNHERVGGVQQRR